MQDLKAHRVTFKGRERREMENGNAYVCFNHDKVSENNNNYCVVVHELGKQLEEKRRIRLEVRGRGRKT